MSPECLTASLSLSSHLKQELATVSTLWEIWGGSHDKIELTHLASSLAHGIPTVNVSFKKILLYEGLS